MVKSSQSTVMPWRLSAVDQSVGQAIFFPVDVDAEADDQHGGTVAHINLPQDAHEFLAVQ